MSLVIAEAISHVTRSRQRVRNSCGKSRNQYQSAVVFRRSMVIISKPLLLPATFSAEYGLPGASYFLDLTIAMQLS